MKLFPPCHSGTHPSSPSPVPQPYVSSTICADSSKVTVAQHQRLFRTRAPAMGKGHYPPASERKNKIIFIYKNDASIDNQLSHTTLVYATHPHQRIPMYLVT